MGSFEDLTENDYKQFFEWLLERDVELEKSFDCSLFSVQKEPYIFYPKEVEAFLQTRPMQRLRRIEQLGTSVLNNVDAVHSRYAHCLGTYHNAVVFYMFQTKNIEWKQRIEDEGRKIEVLADIMEALRHDDGHNILSHGLESLLGQKKGVHERIGARFKTENQDTIDSLNAIHPNLIEAMQKVSSPDYDLITLREGNLDFDRLDFLCRDSLYLGLEDKRKLAYELLRRSHIHKFEEYAGPGKPREMVIYDYEALPFIEEFIETRALLYRTMVSSNARKSLDVLEEEFCRIFVSSDTPHGPKLREYLEHCLASTPETIDLEQFLDWNDLRYYNELIDIAVNEQDPNIAAIATACIPTREGLCSLAIETLDPRRTNPKEYTDDDIEFLKRINAILKKDHPLHDKLVEGVARTCLVTLNPKSTADLEQVLYNLRKKGLTDKEIGAITVWNDRINKYNFNETIFVKDKEGNVFPLQHHPELSIDLSPIYTCGALLVPAKLRRLEIEPEKIELIKAEFEEYNSAHPVEKVKTSRKMQKFQEGEECYIPEYEPNSEPHEPHNHDLR